MTTARWLLAAAGLTAACAGVPPPLRRAPLQLSEEGGRLSAWVEVRVGGAPIRLLVDTGAKWHILPEDFARDRKLRRRPAPEGVFLQDANGNLATFTYLDGVPVQFEGEAAGLLDFITIAGGRRNALLSPQDLVRRGWVVVVDLPRAELRYEEEAAALERLGREVPLRPVPFETCGLFEDAHRVVAVRVNGVEARLALDTGAQRSVLARNSEALSSLLSAEGFRAGVSALASDGRAVAVDDVPVEFAGLSLRTPLLVVPTRYDCGRGLLGMDLLRHCVLVWGSSGLWVGCRPPPGQ